MEENPYTMLVETMRGEAEGPEGLILGKALSWPSAQAPDTPHRVLAGGNAQERGALLRNAALGEYGLEAGDTVVLLPIEESQRYVILCKVVDV